MVEGVSQALVKERRLQSSTAHLWNRGRASEESDSVVDRKRACRAGLAAKLGEETRALLSRRRKSGELLKEIAKFRMLVCPGLNANISPELSFFWARNTNSKIDPILYHELLNRAIHDAADLDRPVLASTQQLQCLDAHQRADLMMYLRPAVEKEPLDHIQRGCRQFFEDAEAESLRGWRIDAIENRVCPRAFHPSGAAVGE